MTSVPKCDHCGRESYEALRTIAPRHNTPERWQASCSGGPECNLVAQGYRLGMEAAVAMLVAVVREKKR